MKKYIFTILLLLPIVAMAGDITIKDRKVGAYYGTIREYKD